MKILHLLGSLDQRSGGPLRAVLDLSAHAQDLGLHSEVLGFGALDIPDNPLAPALIHALPFSGPPSYGYSSATRAWCRGNLSRFDGVILHGMWSHADWILSRECLRAGLPYICFPHGMLDAWSVHEQGAWKRAKKILYWHWRERKVFARAAAAFFTTRRELENARETFRLPEIHPWIVIPYGVAPLAGPRAEPSSNVAQRADTKVALFLGRLHPGKRADLLIRAWKAAELPPEWRLVIAGSGRQECTKYLQELARACGISDVVQFTGAVAGEDKRYLLQRAQWFLLPSEHENFGIALLEAIIAGCAVAVSDQVYLSDALPAGSEILPVNLEAWTAFLRTRMVDDTWHDALVRRTIRQIAEAYGLDAITRGWVSTIQTVLRGCAG
jgi:glycosyltransferase involved in cell wall biosynthesis